MARFLTADAFEAPERRLELLPFRFERRAESYLVSNMVGDFISLAHDEFDRLKDLRLTPAVMDHIHDAPNTAAITRSSW